jgi:NAD(P)-dependent dehydrogenase (short-subunit alcohol dehydrogenase family)
VRCARAAGARDDDGTMRTTRETTTRETTTTTTTTTTAWTPRAMWRPDVLCVMLDWVLALARVMARATVARAVEDARGVDARRTTRGDEDEDEDEEDEEDGTLDVGVFVTGWSSGIGRASALALAKEGFAIVVPYRLGGVDAANAFARECRRAAKDSRVELVGPLDVGSERDVMKVSLSEIRRRGVDVRAVVHCAAVFNTDRNAASRGDGSPTARVNFRNVVRLTDRLVDEARRAGKTSARMRVVFVGSFVHQCATARLLGVDAFRRWVKTGGEGGRYYNPAIDYMWSKVAISAYAAAKHREWTKSGDGGASAVLVDPGLVDTRLIRDWPTALQAFYRLGAKALRLMRDPSDVARGVVRAVRFDSAATEGCPHIYAANGALLGESFWMRDERALGCVRSLAP